MDKKYKKIILWLGIFLALIIVLFVIYFVFFNKVKFLKYRDEEFGFNYGTGFKVNKKNGSYTISEKEGNTKITIDVTENTEGMDSDNNKNRASSISDGLVDDDYKRESFNCLDHICMGVYENDKKQITTAVEFNEENVFSYRLICDKDRAEEFNDDFDLIINSFVKVKWFYE